MPRVVPPSYPKPPAQVAVFSDVIGVVLTVELLMQFGGAEYHFPKRANSSHELVALIGQDLADKLACASNLPKRIPLAKPWLARYFASQGEGAAQIARKLKSSDTAVRKWITSK